MNRGRRGKARAPIEEGGERRRFRADGQQWI